MRRLSIVLLLVVTASVAACSDDGGDRLSQEEFVEQANGICEAGNERIDEALEEAFPESDVPPSAEDAEELFQDVFVPSIEEQIDELEDLNPPEDVEEDFDALLDAARGALDEIRELSGEDILGQSEDPFAEVSEQAEALGLDACAE